MSLLTAERAIVVRQSPENFVSSDFRSHVQGGWNAVHPAVRERMDRMLDSPHATVFRGTGCVKRSRIGWLFAVLSRIFGSPQPCGSRQLKTDSAAGTVTLCLQMGTRNWCRPRK